jgi:hypothetical protein
MSDSVRVSELKRALELLIHHHGRCCHITEEGRDSLSQELFPLLQSLQLLPLPCAPNHSPPSQAQETSPLNIIQYDPTQSDPKPQGKRKRSSVDDGASKNQEQPRWKEEANKFVSYCPSKEEWNVRVERLNELRKSSDKLPKPFYMLDLTDAKSVRDRMNRHAERLYDARERKESASAEYRMYLLCYLLYGYVLKERCLLEKTDLDQFVDVIRAADQYPKGEKLSETYAWRLVSSAASTVKGLTEKLKSNNWTIGHVTTLFQFCTSLLWLFPILACLL